MPYKSRREPGSFTKQPMQSKLCHPASQRRGFLTVTTFLLDLDNTLLGNDMDRFLPPYFVLFAKRLQPLAPGQDVRQLLIDSVQSAIDNHDPTVTNMAAFMAEFTQRLGCPAEKITPILETIYQEDYPQLQRYTSLRPEARQVVQRLFANGCQVVIATQPLFPAVAIKQRLRWAGVAGFPYALITTLENSRFSKPDIRYYQEILDNVGSSPENSWMVGDDPERDIMPAHRLGLKTWWITDEAEISDKKPAPPCDKSGNLAEFLAWLENFD
jgi:FMN phosphatase YigB (HAD superfamily)